MRSWDKVVNLARSIVPPISLPKEFWSSPGGSGIFGNRFGGSHQTRAGVPVGPIDQLELLANAACISVLGKTMGAIPCRVHRKRKSGTTEVAERHPLNEVLSLKANEMTTAFLWQVSSVFNRAIYGNSYSIKDVNGFGQVMALHQCVSANVQPVILENLYQLTEYDDIARPGDIAYEITKNYPYGEKVILPRSRVLHIPYPATLNGFMGVPPLRFTRARVAIGKALQDWESDYFGDGFSPGYMFEIDGSNIGKNKIDDAIKAAHDSYGGFKSNHGIVAFPGKITEATYRLDHAMLSERERKVVEDICGFWGVPTMLIGHSYESTYNNSLEHFLQFRKLTIFPWTENDRQAFDSWLLNSEERRKGFFTAYDPKILDMQDGKAWAEMMQALFRTGSITPDEIRADMKMNPYPDGSGKSAFIQSQNIPLSEAGENGEQQSAGGGLSVVENESEAA